MARRLCVSLLPLKPVKGLALIQNQSPTILCHLEADFASSNRSAVPGRACQNRNVPSIRLLP